MKFFKKKNSIDPQDIIPSRLNDLHDKTIETNNNLFSAQEMSLTNERPKKQPITISSMKRKHILANFIKRVKYLVPPKVVPKGIYENWQNTSDSPPEDDIKFTRRSFESELNYQFWWWKIPQIIQAVMIILFFWMISVQLFFLNKFQQDYAGSIFPISLKLLIFVVITTNIIVRELLIRNLKLKKHIEIKNSIKKEEDEPEFCEEDWYDFNIMTDFFMPNSYGIACALYLPIQLLGYHPIRYFIQSILTIIICAKCWNLSENMESINSWFDNRGMKNEFRLIMLFMLVFAICHSFALIIYSLTYIYPDDNWLTSIDRVVPFTGWYVDYIYAYYFSMTIMVTVGFGDISPKQYIELIVVSLVELVGTAFFGYMINVIGLTVVEINKKREEFDNYISTINKMQGHYQVSTELCQKLKAEVKDYESRMAVTPLNQEQEVKLFQCIQPSVKEQFILETNIKVIKKSIFFLTHFTVNFQNQIALKLIRRIYNKNEKIWMIDQDPNNDTDKEVGDVNNNGEKERYMAIINSGVIDINVVTNKNNIEVKKFVKRIQPIEGKPTVNVFGFSSLILNKNMDLEAMTQEMSTVYLLRKKDLVECISKNMLDFEGVAELREKMLQYRNINEIQAGSLTEIEGHYVPNIMIISKKTTGLVQSRHKQYLRRDRRSKLKLITMKNYQNRTMICIDLESQRNQFSNKTEKKNKQAKTTNISINNILMESGAENQTKFEQSIERDMDQYKNYQNFMKHSNISKVLLKYEKYNRRYRAERRQKTQVQLKRPVPLKLSLTEGTITQDIFFQRLHAFCMKTSDQNKL